MPLLLAVLLVCSVTLARAQDTPDADVPQSAPALSADTLPAADTWPLLPIFMGTDPKLNPKEQAGTQLAAAWIDKPDTPRVGEDGKLVYTYGTAMPSVVCAPLRVCDLELEPGEQVTAVHVGDAIRWKVAPAHSGPEALRTPHLIIKPLEIGLTTTLFVTTDRRPYYVKLISRETDYMPRVGFHYPDAMQRQWAAYYAAQQEQSQRQTLPETGERLPDLDFAYTIEGQARWTPIRVYNDGVKTVIQMPVAMSQTEAPALLVLSPDQKAQLVNYRLRGDRYIVDQLFDRALLIAGVGKRQSRVTITRRATP